ncbi:MAG: hypothetical protein PUA92_08895 [Clostridium sp.]|nr:hypothetical protein [Clostridium sp.]
MNRYDERYEFCLAKRENIDEIMEYIEKYWKRGHILARNRDFFEYEFADGDNVHFVLARDKTNANRIAGLIGYCFCSQNRSYQDKWGVIWSVGKVKREMPMLGVEVFNRLQSMVPTRSEIGVGDDEKTTVPLMAQYYKQKVGKLNHYYMLNDLPDYKIASISKKCVVPAKNTEQSHYLKKIADIQDVITNFNFKKYQTSIPYKDSWYIDKRFFKHPIYNYDIYGVLDKNGNMKAITVLRKIAVGGRKVLRIVDYIGDKMAIQYLQDSFWRMMDTETEYIDFYCYGFEDQLLKRAGFTKREADDCNVIPNYFEPFVQKNVDIWFNSTAEDVTICKADADQDRPNHVDG